MFDFVSLPFWANAVLFSGGGIAIWLAGSRLSMLAQWITRRTRLTEAYAGLVLLAIATSLPEVATSLTAALSGSADLAKSNLLGGVAMQTAVLAVADAIGLKGALTYFSPGPVLLMQAVLVVLLLGLVIAGSAVGSTASVLGLSAGTIAVAVTYAAGLYILKHYESDPGWKVVDAPEMPAHAIESGEEETRYGAKPVSFLGWSFALVSAVVLIAGWLVSQTADAIATQSGISATFIGATLLAMASSLPELSTTVQSARQGAYGMAVANIFGSTALNVALLFAADVCDRGGPILAGTPGETIFIAALGIVLTCVYLGGLLERGNRALLRLGWDSVIVVALYAGGIAILYVLSNASR